MCLPFEAPLIAGFLCKNIAEIKQHNISTNASNNNNNNINNSTIYTYCTVDERSFHFCNGRKIWKWARM